LVENQIGEMLNMPILYTRLTFVGGVIFVRLMMNLLDELHVLESKGIQIVESTWIFDGCCCCCAVLVVMY